MKIDFIAVAIILLFVSIFIFVAKPYGLGISPDSVFYLEVAQNFPEGKGLVSKDNKLVNHWPPMYPILFGSIAAITGIDLLDAGLYFNALLIVVLGFVVLCILKHFKINNWLIYFLLLILFLCYALTVFRFFWSEGLFLVLISTTIFLFVKWIEVEDIKLIALAGIISGLFLMTRFAGAGFIAGFSVFLLLSKGTIFKKIKNTVVYIIPVLFCFFVWHFYTASFEQESLDRKFLFIMISLEKIKTGLMTVYSWFITFSYVSLPVLAVIFIFYFFELKKSFSHFKQYFIKYKPSTLLLFLLLFSYLGLIAFVMLFFESRTTLDFRRLSPIFPIIFLLFALFINYFIETKRTYKITYILLILLIANMSKISYDVWSSHYKKGIGYKSKAFRNSEILKDLPKEKDVILYSNNTFLLRYYSDLKTEFLPRKIFTRAWIPTSKKRYIKEMRSMKETVKSGEGEIVFFNWPVDKRVALKSDILKEFKDYNIIKLKDGFIVRKPI